MGATLTAAAKWLLRFPGCPAEGAAWGMAWGGVLGVVLVAAIFADGQTFGQRCAVEYEKGTADWAACVHRLSQGGSVQLGLSHVKVDR